MSAEKGIKEYFRQFVGKVQLMTDTGKSIEEVCILQLFVCQDGHLELSDRRNRVHLNYGKEKSTIDSLIESLVESSFEESNLDNSFVTVGGFIFTPHWNKDSKELIVSLDTEIVRLVDSGLGQRRPDKTFYITMELSTRRQEMLKRQAFADKLKPVVSAIDMDELLNPVTNGGVIDENAEIEDQEVDENAGEAYSFKNTESRGITPHKSDAPSATMEEQQNVFEHHSALQTFKDDEPIEPRVDSTGDEVNKENMGKVVSIQQTTFEAEGTGSDTEDEEEIAKPLGNIKPKRKSKLKAKLEELSKPQKQQMSETEKAHIDDELADLDLDDEDLKKPMRAVKMNTEVRKRGIRVATDEEIIAPQILGHSFGAFR